MEVDITFLKKNRGYYKPGHGKLTFYRMKGCSFKEKELKIILTLTFFSLSNMWLVCQSCVTRLIEGQ